MKNHTFLKLSRPDQKHTPLVFDNLRNNPNSPTKVRYRTVDSSLSNRICIAIKDCSLQFPQTATDKMYQKHRNSPFNEFQYKQKHADKIDKRIFDSLS